jgi:hypothetical protein
MFSLQVDSIKFLKLAALNFYQGVADAGSLNQFAEFALT